MDAIIKSNNYNPPSISSDTVILANDSNVLGYKEKYLKINKYLSEFKTESERRTARKNLDVYSTSEVNKGLGDIRKDLGNKDDSPNSEGNAFERINYLLEEIEKLIGGDEGSISLQIQDAINDLKGGASTEYDTLKKIEDIVKGEIERLTQHISNTSNPHSVTKEQVGLGNVDNTSDADKPLSTALIAEFDRVSYIEDLEEEPLPVPEQRTADTSTKALLDWEGNPIIDTYAKKVELSNKQNTLVSGTSIKTINSLDLLGSGNIQIKERIDADEEDITLASDKLKLADRSYNPELFSGKGYVILRKNVSTLKAGGNANILTQEMINKPNTIYEIRYDYDLNGEEITIPEGCTLKFDGGSLSNGIIVFTSTKILGDANIYCSCKGSIEGEVNIKWFITEYEKNNDISDKLINIIDTFPNCILTGGTYKISKPIVITNPISLNINATLVFTGTQTNISVITIKDAKYTDIFINELISDLSNTNINLLSDNSNVIGIDITNCNDCKILINKVEAFNEGLRISGIGAGCSYNTFTIGRFIDNNRHIRLYQNNLNGKIGFVNENAFFEGRLMCSSNRKAQGMLLTAIHIAGGDDDTYNKVNGLSFYKFSTEGFGDMNGYTIYAKNISNSNFLDFRNEVGDVFIKFDGLCLNNKFNALFVPNDCVFTNTSVLVEPPLEYLMYKDLFYTNILSSIYVDNDVPALLNNNITIMNIYKDSFITYGKRIQGVSAGNERYGVIINNVENTTFIVNKSSTSRLSVVYLETSDGNIIKPSELNNYPAPGSFYTSDSITGWLSNNNNITAVTIPANIKKIFIGVTEVNSYLDIKYFSNIKPSIEYDSIYTDLGALSDIKYSHNGKIYYDTQFKALMQYNDKIWLPIHINTDYCIKTDIELYFSICSVSPNCIANLKSNMVVHHASMPIPTIVLNNTKYAISKLFKVSPKLIYRIQKLTNSRVIITLLDSSYNRIDFSTNDFNIKGLNIRTNDNGDFLISNTDEITNTESIENISEETFYILLDCYNTSNEKLHYDFIIQSTLKIEYGELPKVLYSNIGSTEDRGTLNITSDIKGVQYFDTTLAKPIWWDGSKWVDSTGAGV